MQERKPDQAGPPDPYPALQPTATPVCETIAARIRRGGPLRFDRYLELALYHPLHGYYARPGLPIGRRGDFFTSVSVGPAFAALLACRLRQWWLEQGRPPRWRLLELGAHDATLATDLTCALGALPELAAPEFALVEPLPGRRGELRAKLAGTPVRVLADPAPLAADRLPGFVIANEVLDALPFRLAARREGRWMERFVTLAPDGGLALAELPPVSPLPLPSPAAFPEGYRTEFRACWRGFLQPLREALASGRLLFFDYGHARAEYYDPLRVTGTLRTYWRHQAGEDPLAAPGALDITAHVDFTALAAAAKELGLELACFEPQGSFLTRHGRPWLLGLAGLTAAARQAAVRQFHALTHPAHLGLRFHAIEFAWREACDPELSRNARRRLE